MIFSSSVVLPAVSFDVQSLQKWGILSQVDAMRQLWYEVCISHSQSVQLAVLDENEDYESVVFG